MIKYQDEKLNWYQDERDLNLTPIGLSPIFAKLRNNNIYYEIYILRLAIKIRSTHCELLVYDNLEIPTQWHFWELHNPDQVFLLQLGTDFDPNMEWDYRYSTPYDRYTERHTFSYERAKASLN